MTGLFERFNPMFSQSDGSTFWMPPQASTFAGEVDWVFYLIYWISVFFFVLIVGVMIWFMLAYRRRDSVDAEGASHHNTYLELTWTVIPLVIVIAIFYYGFTAFIAMKVVPSNAYPIYVTAMKWSWSFQYPNGHIDGTLHVPIDRPVELILTSEDVLHSLFIPAFRVKMDAVPGRTHRIWFQATREGLFPLFCAEYCGSEHSTMVTDVQVHPPGMFERWLEDASDFVNRVPLHIAGERLYNIRGCATCHTLDGAASHGPSFRTPEGDSIWGTTVPLADGSTVLVDEEYITESIYEPNAKIHAGYDAVMPTYRGRLRPQEVNAIIEFIKSLDPAYEPLPFEPPSENDSPEASNGEETPDESGEVNSNG